MAALPRFVFPPSRESNESTNSSSITVTERNVPPQLQLHTEVDTREGFRLAVPSRPSGLLSTPPASPTRLRASTMGAQDLGSMHDDGALTPPATPTGKIHHKTSSASSDFLSTLTDLRRGDSLSTTEPQPMVLESSKPVSTELITFPQHLIDYEFRTNANGKKKTIGEGAWSDVYLATPSLPKGSVPPQWNVATGHSMSPPLTPVCSRESTLGLSNTPDAPLLYAVKVPAMTSAKKVLCAEARILSYLSRLPSTSAHVVPFYGLDTRTGALVLRAMDGTLESWIQHDLNPLPEAARAQRLTAIFPSIALALISSLEWLQHHHCIHADIKPSNILISSPASTTSPPQTLYSDFSSTILSHPDSPIDAEASPLGAGTWDYLDPKLLSSSAPAPLSPATDLWSLAITLLFLVLGTSPYDAFKGNKYQQREMIRSGAPLQCLRYDDAGVVNMRRMDALARELGMDVHAWFARVLVKEPGKRVAIGEWRAELVAALAKK